MPENQARNYYLGKGTRHSRLNCAQSIIAAIKGPLLLEEEIKKYADYGNGGAPEGACGAYAAAKDLLEKSHPKKLQEFEAFFKEATGSLKCKEIRSLKKLSCIGCLDKAEEYLDANLGTAL